MSENPEELMAGYVLNALTPAEAEMVTQWLQDQPALAEEMQQFQEIMALMAHTAPRCSAPPDLRAKILAAAQAETAKRQIARRFTIPWQRVVLVAGILLLLGLGVENYYLNRQLAAAQAKIAALEGPETRFFALKGTTAAIKASGSILLDFHAGKALVALQNLPSLPSGQVYQLWAVSETRKIPCGQLMTGEEGRAVDKIAIPVREYTTPILGMEVTVESEPEPHRPSNLVVMTSHL